MRKTLVPIYILVCSCSSGAASDAGTAGAGASAGESASAGMGGTTSAATAGNTSAGTPGATAGRGGAASAGAGGAASAGAGGMKVLPPVGACDNLPAPGMWENVTPPGMSSKPAVNGTVAAGVVVDPFDPRTVWLGTGGENDEIWRSDDCGATWKRVNTGPGSVGDNMTFGGVGDGAQWSMQVDPVEQGIIYAVSGYGAQSLWKTSDGGQSWKDVLIGSEYESLADYRFVNNVSLDPTDHLHLVVSTHGACKAPYDPNCIAETKDGGSTWRTLKAPEPWVEGGGLIIVKKGLWVWCGTGLMITKDSGASWSNDALTGGGSCEAEYTIRPFEPAANGKYYLGSRSGVLRSEDGATWQHVAGTSGFMVMIAHGSKQVFAANQWSPQISSAKLEADEKWTELPTPPQIKEGSDGGIPFLAYDDAHGILYAAMFSGGIARMVVP